MRQRELLHDGDQAFHAAGTSRDLTAPKLGLSEHRGRHDGVTPSHSGKQPRWSSLGKPVSLRELSCKA
ncbi:hypothetical protein DB31_1193 [Hyalangium minutum]|uniref:Uncharacterized protein n=1 Tax=Hyalangium minutum TaxID=394096 RepID=A0A085WEL5_9BACT|nr:hypothetical protein DB31_1193 [Hyalangium minutum]